MDISFIVNQQENHPVGMKVKEPLEGVEPSEEKVALAVVKQLIRMNVISSVNCKDEKGHTLVELN